ncbi:hypothetical protein T484DRAFT_1907158 [Baffinella frigidus]|nr:hypothetical protein T484DRAFT_1907158 [Cryptophyta sp. CCMP2293]
MVKGLQSLQNALQDQAKSAKRKVQWKLNKRQQRKGKKDREAGSASRAERSCSSPSCSESELGLASEDSFHDGGMEADERENSLSGMGHADGLGDDSLVDGDQASGRRALWDPEIMQQHVLREGGWDKAFALYVVPGDAPGIMRCCCPRTVPLPEGLAAAGDSSEDDWETRRGVSAHPLATQWRGEGNICKTVFPGVQITKFGEQTVAIPFCTCSSLMSLQKALADNVEGLEECPADLILRAQECCEHVQHVVSCARAVRTKWSGGSGPDSDQDVYIWLSQGMTQEKFDRVERRYVTPDGLSLTLRGFSTATVPRLPSPDVTVT